MLVSGTWCELASRRSDSQISRTCTAQRRAYAARYQSMLWPLQTHANIILLLMRFINVISRKHTHTSKLPFSYIEFSVKIVNYPEFIVQVLASINCSDVRGKPWRTRLHYSVAGRAESQEGGGLARAWTDWRSEGASAPTLRWSAGVRGGDGGHGITVLLRFASCK